MVEREWRESSDMRRATVSLVVIIGVAAALRFFALGGGIPYAIGVDEPEVINRVLIMMRTGDFNPHFFDYPSLYIYVQLGVAVLRYLAGAMAGHWHSLNEVTPADFFLWGRAVTAALGTATVFLLYLIGLRWGTRTALLASGLLAVMPLHVRESHFVLTDVPATFFVTLTFLLALRAHEQPQAGAFALAGAAAGLATATKYPGMLALLLPLVAVWMTPAARPSRLVGALAAIGAAAGAFLLAAPYTVLDLPGFLNGYGRLTASYTAEPPAPPWTIYLKHLRDGLHWPAFLLALAGAAIAVWRASKGPGRVRWTLALVFPIVFFWFVSRHSLVFGRYLLPLVPFVCLLAGAAVVSGVSLLRRFSIPRALRTALIAGLTVATILPPGLTSLGFNSRFRRTSTATLAGTWIAANLPRDARVVTEPGAPVLASLPLHVRTIAQLRLRTYEDYLGSKVDYLVASSQAYGRFLESSHLYPNEYADYMRIFEQAREIARFTPDGGTPGPEIRVFALRPRDP